MADVTDQLQALQQAIATQQMLLQQQQGQIDMMSAQLKSATERANRADEDRSRLIELATKGGGLVDTKGVGQPFKYSGKIDQDFSEWDHKMITFLRAKYGANIEDPLKWAVRQRKTIVKEVGALDSSRVVAWDPEYGSSADAIDQIEGFAAFVDGLYTYLVSFTTGDANKIVRNAGPDGMESWRRLHVEYDPTSSMRRVAILGLVQNPQKCKSVDDLGQALADWLARKRQYEEFSDRDGNPCRVSEDSLMAALYKLMPPSLEEAVMFRSEDYPTFTDLFDKLSSFASTKHSLFLSQRDMGSSSVASKKDPNAMDIGAIGKGKAKDKGKGKQATVCFKCGRPGHKQSECRSSKQPDKGGKGQGRKDSVRCWVCEGFGHYGKDCPSKKGKGKGGDDKGKGKSKPSGGGVGKGKPSASSVEEPQSEPQQRDLGYLDLNSFDDGAPPYVVQHGGKEWVRFNYDSGAAATVFPVEMVAGEIDLKEVGQYTVASGGGIARYGDVRMKVLDEVGNCRSITGSVAGVHKPLGSAAEFSKGHDCWLWSNGGMLIPKQGKLCQEMRRAFNELCRKHSDGTELPIYREGNLYNFYVQRTGSVEELSAMAEHVSGGPRPAQL